MSSNPTTILIGPLSVDDSRPKFKGSKAKFAMAEKEGQRKTVFKMVPNKTYFKNKKLNNPNDGEFSHVPGSKYKGEWKNNKKWGFGTQTYRKGDVYEGEWENDRRSGKGTYYVLKNKKLSKEYAGDWLNDKKDGLGVFIDSSGNKYEGMWKDGLKHGEGKLVMKNGETYEGEWSEGVKEGLGTLTLENGDQYVGSFAGGKKEGPGRFFYYSTNKVYEGEWVDGAPKCGEFKSMPPRGGGTSETFLLPSLTLSDVQSVLSSAVAEVRQDRAARGGGGGGGGAFNEKDLEQIKLAFKSFSNEEGMVKIMDLQALLESLGVKVGAGELESLLERIGAEEDDDLTYAEFVDIVVVVSGGV
ncbi:hypothetical protein TrCOL_g6727 [Triparma columacea]|uniref:MORN repeat-containing protein 3 n=1 Tax=Triparma columacea TaxID=722753 RepID=A0A9W7G7T8_9STRA|nr:hypothetical protein TrCOL_g6727 [Triparma columacea]